MSAHVPRMLTGRELDVLRALAEHRGQTLSPETLLAAVWSGGWVGSAATLDVTIGRLCEWLAGCGTAEWIVTVSELGYRLEQPIG